MTEASAKKRKSRGPNAEPATRRWWDLYPRSAYEWSVAAVFFAAVLLRVLFLTLKPLHHDEGVNGLFLVNLFRSGFYHYDPANYHGPTLYYIALIPAAINSLLHWGHGLSTVGIRLVTASFGVGILWLMLCLRRYMGEVTALSAAIFATVSPGFVYFSRYFIHEILFVFFSLGVIVTWLRYRETGQPRYLMLASASAAMLFATKETWIITVAVWLIAIPCTRIYLRLRNGPGEKQAGAADMLAESASSSKVKQYGIAAGIFIAIGVLFYSSFFTNFPQGVIDSIRTFTYWTKTGQTGIYNRDWWTYFTWMWQEEAPILGFGAIGIAIALLRARNALTVFCAFWSMGIVAAYSLVPYKTPWLLLSLLLPLAIMAGYAVSEAFQPGLRAFTVIIAGVGVLFSLYQAIDISFVHYDDDSYAYVYAHTSRDFLSLVNEIDAIAAANPAKKDIGITVMSPEHWPLPWYLREYTHVGYWGHLVDTSEPIVIALQAQELQVERQFGGKYRMFSSHDLRPGNRLILFVRKDIQMPAAAE